MYGIALAAHYSDTRYSNPKQAHWNSNIPHPHIFSNIVSILIPHLSFSCPLLNHVQKHTVESTLAI